MKIIRYSKLTNINLFLVFFFIVITILIKYFLTFNLNGSVTRKSCAINKDTTQYEKRSRSRRRRAKERAGERSPESSVITGVGKHPQANRMMDGKIIKENTHENKNPKPKTFGFQRSMQPQCLYPIYLRGSKRKPCGKNLKHMVKYNLSQFHQRKMCMETTLVL